MSEEKKVNVNRLSNEEIAALQVQIGEKIREICDEAIEKANKLLNIYSLSAKMQIAINYQDLDEPKKVPSVVEKETLAAVVPKKRGKPKKVVQQSLS